MWDNAYLSIKNTGWKWLALLAQLCFTVSANFGLRSFDLPWPNPGSAPNPGFPRDSGGAGGVWEGKGW